MTIATMSTFSNLANISETAPARDGDVAIQEEFEAARRAHNSEAYQLFIERHPDHLLRRAAQEELDRLQRSKLFDHK